MGTVNTMRLDVHGEIGTLYVEHYKPGLDEDEKNDHHIHKFRLGRKTGKWMDWPVDFSLEEAKCLHEQLTRMLK